MIFSTSLMYVLCIVLLALVQSCFSGDTDYFDCFKNPSTCLKYSYENLTAILLNRHLVMIGDSLTRYQYMSLVYTLRHGHVVSPNMSPNIVQEKDWAGGWNEYYKSTTNLLKPYEVCDCYRPDGGTDSRVWFENHYYHDDSHNITVTFISFVGNPVAFSHGHIFASEVNDVAVTERYPLTYHTEDKWKFDSLSKLVSDYVAHFPTKPSAIILNCGRWDVHLTDVEVSEIVFSAFEVVDLFIWKSTTFASGDDAAKRANFDRVDNYFRAFDVVSIMDTSWTKNLDDGHRWDAMHFREPVYSVLNIQLLDLLTAGFNKIVEIQ